MENTCVRFGKVPKALPTLVSWMQESAYVHAASTGLAGYNPVQPCRYTSLLAWNVAAGRAYSSLHYGSLHKYVT
jgi:hypothetical protein